MKQIILFTALLISTSFYSQNIEKLKLSPQGVAPIVISVDSLKANDIYKKAVNWVQETYKSPENVLKAQIENEKIRINAISENVWQYKSLGSKFFYDMEYSIQISFKDGRYKFEFSIGQFYIHGGQKVYFDYTAFFKKNGEVRKEYTNAVPDIENVMNNLSSSLYNYLTGKTKTLEDGW